MCFWCHNRSLHRGWRHRPRCGCSAFISIYSDCHGLQATGYSEAPVWYKFGGLLTSTFMFQLCTTGVDQRSSKYIYVRQVAAQLCLAILPARGRLCGARLCHAFLVVSISSPVFGREELLPNHTKSVAMATSLERSKARPFVCTHRSINPVNLLKTGPVYSAKGTIKIS